MDRETLATIAAVLGVVVAVLEAVSKRGMVGHASPRPA